MYRIGWHLEGNNETWLYFIKHLLMNSQWTQNPKFKFKLFWFLAFYFVQKELNHKSVSLWLRFLRHHFKPFIIPLISRSRMSRSQYECTYDTELITWEDNRTQETGQQLDIHGGGWRRLACQKALRWSDSQDSVENLLWLSWLSNNYLRYSFSFEFKMF